MIHREQNNDTSIINAPSITCMRNEDCCEMREPPATPSGEIVLTPTRQFWRRWFRSSPASTTSSSSSSSPSSSSLSSRRKIHQKNNANKKQRDRNNSRGDGNGCENDINSQSSSSSSSQSGSDSSAPQPNREQRVAKYLSIDTTATALMTTPISSSPCRPISLIANDGDLTFQRSSRDARDDNYNNDDDDYDDESTLDCRDDVCLLNGPVIFQSHLLHTPKALREPAAEEEDRVALLSEHDDLLENRRGSYNVDIVDPSTINEPAALQELSLLTMEQELAAQIEKFRSQPSFPCQLFQEQQDLFQSDSQQHQEFENAVVPIQIHFPSGETTKGLSGSKPSLRPPRSPKKSSKTKVSSRSEKAVEKKPQKPSVDTADEPLTQTSLNPLGEETPAFSEIIQDRTQRHKAFYLLRLRNSQRKQNSNPRPAVHGDLWTLTELPSEDECSRFSQVSESLASRLRISRSGSGERSGAYSTGLNQSKNLLREDQMALISAN